MQFLSYLFGLLLQFPEPSFLAGDTGDTGDSGDTEETDTEETDSSETGDSAVTDTECASATDSGCEDALQSAMELAGENGGFGCAALGTGSAIALWGSVLIIGMRRED